MKRASSLLVIIGLLVLTSAVVLAAPPEDYDTNGNGFIDRNEMEIAIQDFLDERLSLDDTLQLLALYISGKAIPTPTPVPVPTPTKPYNFNWFPTSTPTPVPAIPTAPNITYTRINQESLQIKWQYSSPDITGYEVRYRQEGRSWVTKHFSSGTSGVSFVGKYAIGARYEVQVRAVNRAGASQWTGKTLTVLSPLPTHTPTPFVPTPIPTPFSNAYGVGCWGHETDFPLWPPSDVKMVAWFENPGEAEREPWEAPSTPAFSYGFMVRAIPAPAHGNGIGLLMLVKSDGTWTLELRSGSFEARHGDVYERGVWVRQYNQWRGYTLVHRLSEGNFEDVGITFNSGSNERNHLVFIAEGDSYQLLVNGQDVPLNIQQEDIDAVRRVVAPYYYYDSGKWQGYSTITYWSETMDYPRPRPLTGGSYWGPSPRSGHMGWRLLPSVRCVP